MQRMSPDADVMVLPSRIIPPAHARDAALGGLSSDEARRRLIAYGPNEIEREPATPGWRILARQFNSPVIWLLVGACAISSALGEAADAIVIAAIVVLNGCVGFFQ